MKVGAIKQMKCGSFGEIVKKEKVIKEVANKYKDVIPNKLYEALYKWEVEIND